ncbi:MAG TPA: penicillin-binding protein 2 [Thermoleophilaceae bacterium]|nr:penicillin-binding protein 2 [Thermoleophilaceae bacterium]
MRSTLLDRRIGLLFAVFLLLLGLATLRATWLGTVKADSLSERAATQQVEELKVPAGRGTITDRKGVELAVSEEATTVFANPMLIKNPSKVAAELAPLLGRDQSELLPLLSDKDKGFVYLRRKLDPTLGDKISRLRIEGIDTVSEPNRTYPQGALAGQLLGSVGLDGNGLAGIEQQFDQELHGEDGQRKLVKDATGKVISLADTKRQESGEDLKLTIDAALQERVEAVLGQVARDHRPKGATALVMDPRNGELLAMANYPRVNPNDLINSPKDGLQNRAVGSAFEPGSTFKAFTVAGALQDGKVTPETELDLPSQLQVADRTIGEAHDRGAVTLTTAQILAQSSNVGSVMIGQKLGPARFDHWVRKFGFGKPTGVSLPGEGGGIVPAPKDYSGSSMGNLPIGQGLAVTPLQMAAGFSALANGGVLHRPHVVAGQSDPGKRVVAPKTAAQVARMLEGVLAAGGTAQEASIPGYKLAGKTGTAQKPDPENGGYSEFKFFSSFIGFAPAENPRLMVAVMVDEPTNGYYGGEVAAPAFEKIVSFALPYMKIPPSG